jgi:penicillin-binding protein 2
MAQALSTLASGGVRFKPHLVHEIEDVIGGAKRPANAEPLPTVAIDPKHLAVIRNAMVGVNREGTSAAAFRDAGYTSGGKTGTAQVIGVKKDEKYSASKLEEHLRDHALFIAYAPAENPKIVVALIVENAGWGAQSAAPIARRVFDYWLMQQLPTDQDIAAVSTGGTPLPPKRVLAADGSASSVAPIPVSSVTVASHPAATTATAAAATARLVAASTARAASTPAGARPAAAAASSHPANAATTGRAASAPSAVRAASAAPRAPVRVAPSPARPASAAAHSAASAAPRPPAAPASKPSR